MNLLGFDYEKKSGVHDGVACHAVQLRFIQYLGLLMTQDWIKSFPHRHLDEVVSKSGDYYDNNHESQAIEPGHIQPGRIDD